MSDNSKERLTSYEKLRCIDLMTDVRMCLSAFYQFHQYYIYGQFTDCSDYKKRVKYCIKWKSFHSDEAKEKLIESLEAEKRSKTQITNSIWKQRESPPSDW